MAANEETMLTRMEAAIIETVASLDTMLARMPQLGWQP